MDFPGAIARNVGHEPLLSGLVAGGHAGGFASMLQCVAIGATWGQKSRQVGRQDFRQSPTSTSQGPWDRQDEPWNRQNGPNGAGYGSPEPAYLEAVGGPGGWITLPLESQEVVVRKRGHWCTGHQTEHPLSGENPRGQTALDSCRVQEATTYERFGQRTEEERKGELW